MSQPRKLHIKSYGCQMNVYDAQRMVDTLAGEGFVETASADDADLVILNTCHIREKASEKVYSELGRLRAMKDEAARHGRKVNIAVAGCVAQAEGEEIIRRAPVVDIVVGPQSYHHLPQLLARAKRDGRALETEFPVEDKFGFLPAPKPDAIRARGIGRRSAPPLFAQPSVRRRGFADRGASRQPGADALRASAGAVGLRPHPCGHEPQAYRCRIPRCYRAFPARTPRHCVFIGFY